MSSVQNLTLQTGHVTWCVWRRTLHALYRGGMTNNSKPRPLAAIVGERLKLFRQEKGLRQEDVAEAARTYGVEWGRSSIAALEAGNRDLRLEELIVLGAAINHLGGWGQPFIPGNAEFKVTGLAHMYVSEAFRSLMKLTIPSEVEKPSGESQEGEELMRLGAIETPRVNKFEKQQSVARNVIVFDRILHVLWPEQAGVGVRSFAGNTELGFRMAERVRWPDSGEPIDPSLVGTLAYGTWGRPLAEERDARTDARGSYETKRALQSARGHVTRELIDELQTTLNSRYTEIREILNGLESVIHHEGALNDWVNDSYAIEDRVKRAGYRAKSNSGTRTGIFKSLRGESS
jgi:transcriptional regulator with XRE-family HTH domain